MVVKGKLNLSRHNDDYIIFEDGRNANISNMLNLMLFDYVSLHVENTYNDETLVDISGKLIKEKVAPCLYLFHIDGVDIDSILWGLIGRKLKIELNNITEV